MKTFSSYILALLLVFITNNMFASPLYQNDNQSADFVRTINRGASVDVDAAYFNPAGLVFMQQDGLIFQFSNQFITQKRKVTDSSSDIKTYVGNGENVTYEGGAYTWSYPVFYMVYKKDKLAFYGHFGFIGAGASAFYKNGLPSLDIYAIRSALSILPGQYGENLVAYDSDNSVEAYAVFMGFSCGVSYALFDKLSVALGARYVYAIQETKLKMNFKNIQGSGGTDLAALRQNGYFSDVDIHSLAHGGGFGFILGVDFKPNRKLMVAFKYEYFTKMELVYEKPENFDVPENLRYDFEQNFKEGLRENKTLPMSTGIGISYMLLNKLRVEFNAGYYFNTLTKWGTDNSGKDVAEEYQDSYGYGLAFEYIVSSQLLFSIGGGYSSDPRTRKSRTEAEFNPDSYTLGFGCNYRYSNNLDFTIGLMSVFFDKQQGTDMSYYQQIEVDYTFDFAFGVTYRIMH